MNIVSQALEVVVWLVSLVSSDVASQALEVAMLVVAFLSALLNYALVERGYQRIGALEAEKRNGVLLTIANHDVRQTWHRLGISLSLMGVCGLFLSIPNALDIKAMVLKILVLGICIHVGWKSWDDRVTSRRVNEKLDAMEVAH